jgi:hypothetical protein
MNKALVLYLLQLAVHRNLPLADITVQGFGLLRIRVSPDVRVHVWHSLLRYPNVSEIHDHEQWAFTSTIFSGLLMNTRFTVVESAPGALACHGARIQTGMGGGLKDSLPDAWLLPCTPEAYVAGGTYRQEPNELHVTMALDGTVTAIEQERKDTETARVYWPRGRDSRWGTAEPRAAEWPEIEQVVGDALRRFAA